MNNKKNNISLPQILTGVKNTHLDGLTAYFSSKENTKKQHYIRYFGAASDPKEFRDACMQYGKENIDETIKQAIINILLENHKDNPQLISKTLVLTDIISALLQHNKPFILRIIKDELLSFIGSHAPILFDKHLEKTIRHNLPYECIHDGLLQTFRTKINDEYIFDTTLFRRQVLIRIATIERTMPGKMPSDQNQMHFLFNQTIQSLTQNYDSLQEVYYADVFYLGFIGIVHTKQGGDKQCIVNTNDNQLIQSFLNPDTEQYHTIKTIEAFYTIFNEPVYYRYGTATVEGKPNNILFQENTIITSIEGYIILHPKIIHCSRGKIVCSKVSKQGVISYQLFYNTGGKRQRIDTITYQDNIFTIKEVYKLSADMKQATLSVYPPGTSTPLGISVNIEDFSR